MSYFSWLSRNHIFSTVITSKLCNSIIQYPIERIKILSLLEILLKMSLLMMMKADWHAGIRRYCKKSPTSFEEQMLIIVIIIMCLQIGSFSLCLEYVAQALQRQLDYCH